jgi:hypothetical protein
MLAQAPSTSIKGVPVAGQLIIGTEAGVVPYLPVLPSGTPVGRVNAVVASTSPFTASTDVVVATDAGLWRACCSATGGSTADFGASGGYGSVRFTSGTPVSPTADVPWITVLSAAPIASGSTLAYRIEPNPDATGRTGLLSFGRTIQVTQSGACTFTLGAPSVSVWQNAQTGTVSVATQPGCAWTATSGSAFVTITNGGSGVGNGTVEYSVASNVSPIPRFPADPRDGVITIGDQTFTVYQDGYTGPCSFALSPSSASVSSAGGRNSLSVTDSTPFGVVTCGYTATTDVPWLTVTAGATAGTWTYTVARNPTGLSRIGSIFVAFQRFTVTQSGATSMAIDRSSLAFGARTVGSGFASVTPDQVITLSQVGSGTVTWTAGSGSPWLKVLPASGTGSGAITVGVQYGGSVPPAGTLTGTVIISYGGAMSGTTAIPVTFTLVTATTPPTGVIDTPQAGQGSLQGSVAITGWAIDDIGVERVEIWRDLQPGEPTPPFTSTPSDPRNGMVFIGTADMVDGARPDIEAASPNTPLNSKAGWGYMLLTWGLYNQGNGNYTFTVFAFDKEGNVASLGRRTVNVNNSAADRPFGNIDTPTAGATVSGAVMNFGWGLTPKLNGAATCRIPSTGAAVSIDSGPLQPVAYGDARSDVTAGFTGFSNSAAPGGHFVLDTTTLVNGRHTIGWLLTDDCSRADGVGSRFFTVENAVPAVQAAPGTAAGLTAERRESDAPITVSRGFGELSQTIGPDATGQRIVRMTQGERIELRVPSGFTMAQQIAGRAVRPVPAGSTWDEAARVFYWQPAAAFLGDYELRFAHGAETITVHVLVVPPR